MLLKLKLGLFAAAAATASADKGSLRVLHDVNHHKSRTNGVSEVKAAPRSGGIQSRPCLLMEEIEETQHGVLKSWWCMLEDEDVETAGCSGSQAAVEVEGIGYVLEAFEGEELPSGTLKILASGGVISDDKLYITNTDIDFFSDHSRRKLKATVGTQKALVVRVTTSDGKTPEPSAAQMSDKVFGTSGDVVNAKSVFEGCSHGKMTVVPATGNGVVNGVMELTSSAGSTGGEHPIYNDVLSKLQTHFSVSDLATMFEFVLIAIPPGILGGAWAYAQTPYSIYGDPNILYPTMTVHEMGHNLNLHHANEGAQANGDHQGMMGYVVDHDEGTAAKLCYNPAKNWFIGWYSDRLKEVKPQLAEYSGKLIGVGNYDKISGDDQIVLKIAGPSGDEDYYVGYNHATGWNEGTHESINQVTVVKQSPGMAVSNKVASLGQGQEYKIDNYLNLGQAVTIKVNQIDANTSSGFAAVQICFGACGSNPNPSPTPAPVPSPTSAPGGACTDNTSWVDTDGWTCQDYKTNNMCDPEGSWAVGGVGANDVCCDCKGSGTAPSPTPAPGPSGGGCTENTTWSDTDGWTCQDYKDNNMCDPDGSWAVGGVGANDVCCDCK